MERIGQIEYDKSDIIIFTRKEYFVKVFRGTFRDENKEAKPVAVKRIEHHGYSDINFEMEESNLEQLKGHPNVVSYYGVELDARF